MVGLCLELCGQRRSRPVLMIFYSRAVCVRWCAIGFNLIVCVYGFVF